MTTYTLAGLAAAAILTELALSVALGHHTGVLLLAAALTAATVTHTIRTEKESH
nr:MAG TPA: Formate hydrogenlyase maturation protein HycH [Caudoviricetes sp.]